ncbi:MAG: ADP-glyceromanno-heptose 6-epimerase [Bacteroidia bacterium]|nr:ADP-glyceromanno-heptose 6-epimerase [Bacteroidia bacterium]
MIVLTGAAGFIGSYVARKLNSYGITDLVLVDDFTQENKIANFAAIDALARVDRTMLFETLRSLEYQGKIDAFIHLGARTDTTEQNTQIFDELNVQYSQKVWQYCAENNVALIYASSAATYGDGSKGYDDHTLPAELQPLNPYGRSKNDFDRWALEQTETPPYWLGLKFFNVYGPNEYHKGRMASVVFHAFNQIRETGKMRLFRSHKEGYKDGEQKRDFIFVDDIAEYIWFAYKCQPQAGLLNMGTGEARSFLDLVHAVFKAMDREPQIEFIDTPEDIRDSYQYFTEAETAKLKATEYNRPFHSLEEGVEKYVKQYLIEGKHY